MSGPGTLGPMGLPKAAVERAARQGGYIKRPQLLELGMSSGAVDWAVNVEELTLVSPGVYRVFPSDDHIDLIRGAVLALPSAVASHQSAAHLLAFPQLPKLVPTVTVASHTTHKFPGVMVRRSDDLQKSHLTTVDGVRVTNIPRTVFGLAGILRYKEFVAITEALIIAGRMKESHFERIVNELARRGKPGSRNSRDFLEMRAGGDPGATTLERKGRAILVSAGLPAPIPQYPIPWSPKKRFDDAYPGAKVALEWDSRAWHLQGAAMDSDRRRDREAALHGWIVLRYTWEDITKRPAEIASTVGTLLRERRAM